MGNYKIHMNVSVVDEVNESNSISVESEITPDEACSIDAVEKAFLVINRETIKVAIIQHLEEISKKSQGRAKKNWRNN